MASPADLQTNINAVQWTNGRGLITGATLLGVMTIVLGIFSSQGTWDGSGNFTPNIPAGAVTSAMLAPGVAAGLLGATGVGAGPYGDAADVPTFTVGADGRITAAAPVAIAIPPTALTGPLASSQLPYQSCPLAGCTLTGLLGLPPYTVATLPACAVATKDQVAIVSDATNPTYRGTLTGGGAARTLVECDGSAWLSH